MWLWIYIIVLIDFVKGWEWFVCGRISAVDRAKGYESIFGFDSRQFPTFGIIFFHPGGATTINFI
jgi:hypothetical protein